MSMAVSTTLVLALAPMTLIWGVVSGSAMSMPATPKGFSTRKGHYEHPE